MDILNHSEIYSFIKLFNLLKALIFNECCHRITLPVRWIRHKLTCPTPYKIPVGKTKHNITIVISCESHFPTKYHCFGQLNEPLNWSFGSDFVFTTFYHFITQVPHRCLIVKIGQLHSTLFSTINANPILIQPTNFLLFIFILAILWSDEHVTGNIHKFTPCYTFYEVPATTLLPRV